LTRLLPTGPSFCYRFNSLAYFGRFNQRIVLASVTPPSQLSARIAANLHGFSILKKEPLAMAEPSSLADRIDAEFAAAKQRNVAIQNQDVRYFQERQQRLEAVDKILNELRSIWRDQLDELAKLLGERVKVVASIAAGNRIAKFSVQSRIAQMDFRFAVFTDDDVRNLIFQYDLEVVPASTKYDSHSELSFPMNNVDRRLLAEWISDRIISFMKTYLSVHDTNS
jgi:hypothetical protein